MAPRRTKTNRRLKKEKRRAESSTRPCPHGWNQALMDVNPNLKLRLTQSSVSFSQNGTQHGHQEIRVQKSRVGIFECPKAISLTFEEVENSLGTKATARRFYLYDAEMGGLCWDAEGAEGAEEGREQKGIKMRRRISTSRHRRGASHNVLLPEKTQWIDL
eukprot:1195338-Prorocentrum_minimum.AAC.1